MVQAVYSSNQPCCWELVNLRSATSHWHDVANSKVRPNDVQVVTYLTDREKSDAYGSGKTLPRVICNNLFAYVREIERRGCAENGDYEKKKWAGSLTRGWWNICLALQNKVWGRTCIYWVSTLWSDDPERQKLLFNSSEKNSTATERQTDHYEL